MNSSTHFGSFALTGLLILVMQNPSNVFNNNGKLEVKLDCVRNIQMSFRIYNCDIKGQIWPGMDNTYRM